MSTDRRQFISSLAGAAVVVSAGTTALAAPGGEESMYGLIGTMTAQPGNRDALVNALIGGLTGMPGCLSYVVAKDPSDPNLIWVTEAWESKEAHAASLSLPSVRDAIAKARPLIAGMTRVAETVPVGGYGLPLGQIERNARPASMNLEG